MRMVRQLGREDWIGAGLAALAAGGSAGVRVEAVARGLGVSKGSFYWHFRDRADWRDAMLAYWEHRVFLDLIRSRHTSRAPSDDALGRGAARALAVRSAARAGTPPRGTARPAAAPGAAIRPTAGTAAQVPCPAALEAAFRVWARDDAQVARALARVLREEPPTHARSLPPATRQGTDAPVPEGGGMRPPCDAPVAAPPLPACGRSPGQAGIALPPAA